MVNINIVTVTPQLASDWLATSGDNYRPCDDRAVRKLVSDMREGRFNGLNGETVKFDQDNRLEDGQHRLTAIVKSGLAQRLIVVSGVEPDAVKTIDIGKPRSLADELRREGHQAGRRLQGVLTLMWHWRNGDFTRARTPSHAELLALLDDLFGLPDLMDTVRDVIGRPLYLQPSAAVAARYALTTVDAAAATLFFNQLADGLNLAANDPVYALRRLLLKSDRRRWRNHEQLALVIKAWNATRAGRSLQMLGLRRDEEFPRLAGWPWPVTGSIDGQPILTAVPTAVPANGRS